MFLSNMNAKTSRAYLSWDDVEKLVEVLAEKIKESGFEPDYLIGVTVGGLVPLTLVANEMGIKQVTTVTAGSYKKDEQGDLTISCLPEVDLEGKKILLIDEIADSGQTLREVSRLIVKKYKPALLQSAVIVKKNNCPFEVDQFALETNDWVVFPWEKKEFPEFFTNH
jgi:uncharacterized protein